MSDAAARNGSGATPPAEGVRPLRVGVDFHVFDGIFQGSRSYLLGIYRAAIRLAPDIEWVFLLDNPEGLRAQHPEFAAPNVRCVAMPHRSGMVRLGWQLAAAQWQEQFDLLHVQYRIPLIPLGPCAVTIHDILFESHPQFFSPGFVRMSRLTSRIAARRAALLFTVSAFSRDAMASVYGIDPARITITHNCVDLRRFFPAQHTLNLLARHGHGVNNLAVHAVLSAQGGRSSAQGTQVADQNEVPQRHGLNRGGYFCTLGRLEPRKNHLALVQAYARLPRSRPPLVVIGQRDFSFNGVFDAVAQLGLKDEVRFLEKVGDEELPALLRHASVFAYPTHAEGFGMPAAEAMASGVPVVTSNTTSLPEVVGRAARTVAPDDIDGLCAALLALHQLTPEKRAQRVAEGLQQVARWSDWGQSAQRMLQAIRQWDAARGHRRR